MTHLTISDDLASNIASVAANRDCTSEELLQSLFSHMESDAEFAERLLTPQVQAEILQSLEQADQGNFVTSEEVDRRFEALFRELKSR